MGFNWAFKGLNRLDPGNVHLNNLNAPVLNVLRLDVSTEPSIQIMILLWP